MMILRTYAGPNRRSQQIALLQQAQPRLTWVSEKLSLWDDSARQTVMAFRAGTQLSEHLNPGEATVFVIKGSIWLKAGAEAWQGKAGDLLIVPDGMHSLEAEEDSAILFTAVKLDR